MTTGFVGLAVMVVGILLTSGCDGQTSGGDPAAGAAVGGIPHPADVVVMTRNVYVGADVDPILEAADPSGVPQLVDRAFQTVLATNFPERAGALAREFADVRPHLVGLQEISLIRTQSPGDAAVGNPVSAQDTLFDYLSLLLDSLRSRGLDYHVAGKVENADVEVPLERVGQSGSSVLSDIRLTDFDVVLARGDVDVSRVEARSYADSLVSPVASIARGFVALTATVEGHQYRFVSTHLEPPGAPTVQRSQARELIAHLRTERLPVILVGDLNTVAEARRSSYQEFLEAGFTDAWTVGVGEDDSGNTCCHAPDLLGTRRLEQRIDFVFVRDGLEPPPGANLSVVRVTVIGNEPRDRTGSGLWPSDHAGVVAQLRPQGR